MVLACWGRRHDERDRLGAHMLGVSEGARVPSVSGWRATMVNTACLFELLLRLVDRLDGTDLDLVLPGARLLHRLLGLLKVACENLIEFDLKIMESNTKLLIK